MSVVFACRVQLGDSRVPSVLRDRGQQERRVQPARGERLSGG